MDRWHGELDAIGHTPASILDSIERSAPARRPAERLSEREIAELVGWVLSPTGPLAGDKRFGRAEVIRHLAPKLHGRHPDELTRALGVVLAHPEALPLLGQPGARNRSWVLASTRAAEQAIAGCADRLAESTGVVSVDTATSGQAAKTLGVAAHLESGTTASLLWRLQHGHDHLDRNFPTPTPTSPTPSTVTSTSPAPRLSRPTTTSSDDLESFGQRGAPGDGRLRAPVRRVRPSDSGGFCSGLGCRLRGASPSSCSRDVEAKGGVGRKALGVHPLQDGDPAVDVCVVDK